MTNHTTKYDSYQIIDLRGVVCTKWRRMDEQTTGQSKKIYATILSYAGHKNDSDYILTVTANRHKTNDCQILFNILNGQLIHLTYSLSLSTTKWLADILRQYTPPNTALILKINKKKITNNSKVYNLHSCNRIILTNNSTVYNIHSCNRIILTKSKLKFTWIESIRVKQCYTMV
jgi:hypothetical protein